jgi:glycosyltransferase involved in cell wall biosynthesis
MFSIVIPIHNKENYLKNTLHSVISQSFKDFEIILVNDGSTDNSANICEEFRLADSRVKVIHQQNSGVSAARNVGIKHSCYDLIAFIDADDYWSPIFLEKMHELILQLPDILIYSSKYANVKGNRIYPVEPIFKIQSGFTRFDLIRYYSKKINFPIHSSSVIIKKKAIEQVGFFDERIYMYEDYDLFLRLALISEVGYLNTQPLSFYNIDVPAGSKARGKFPLLEKNWVYYFDKFDSSLKENKHLNILLDTARLNQMLFYRRLSNYSSDVRSILSKVSKSNYDIKYQLIFLLPVFLGDFLIKLFSSLSFFKSLIISK